MTTHNAPTSDLLSSAAYITDGTQGWTPDQRAAFVDAGLAEIVEALEARGYGGSWDHWVATGAWDAVYQRPRCANCGLEGEPDPPRETCPRCGHVGPFMLSYAWR